MCIIPWRISFLMGILASMEVKFTLMVAEFRCRREGLEDEALLEKRIYLSR